jgi:hypothetical protein
MAKTLNQIIFFFLHQIQNIFFSNIVSRGQTNSDRLEKVQHEAARIVTGLPSFASIHSIYIETGWEKLKTRREVRKLVK